MRCPKCGFISFDHLESCLKCKKNIKAAADALPGSVLNVATPTFLRFDRKEVEESADVELFEAEEAEEIEIADEDLDVLITDSQEADQAAMATGKQEEDQDREIDFDLSQFEDTAPKEETLVDQPVEDQAVANTSAAPAIAIPEELADISDLAPPGKAFATAPPPQAFESDAPADGLSDLKLDDLDIDLRLDDLDDTGSAQHESLGETVLSLDELDFTETLPKSGGTATRLPGGEMDDELNFDLDLGGLSIDKGK